MSSSLNYRLQSMAPRKKTQKQMIIDTSGKRWIHCTANIFWKFRNDALYSITYWVIKYYGYNENKKLRENVSDFNLLYTLASGKSNPEATNNIREGGTQVYKTINRNNKKLLKSMEKNSKKLLSSRKNSNDLFFSLSQHTIENCMCYSSWGY